MALGPLSPAVDRQFFDDAGNVLSGGLIYVYLAGTSTPTDTYTTSALTTPNANPVVCDSAGRATMFLDPDITYKFDVQDSGGVSLYTLDNVPGVIPVQTPITVTEDGIGSTSTDGLILLNTTAAANGAQQWSPRTRWTGRGWNATASASRVVDVITEAVPVQQASGDPVVQWVLSTQVNAGGYTPRLSIGSDGALALNTSLLTISAAGALSLNGGAYTISATSDTTQTGYLAINATEWPTVTVAKAAARVGVFSTSGDQIVIAANMASGVGVDRGAEILLGSRGTTATEDLAFASFRGARESGVSGNKSSYAVISTCDLNGTPSEALRLASNGLATFGGAILLSDTAATMSWDGQTVLTNVANGSLKLSNNAVTAGVTLKFSTDAQLDIRDRADAAFADLRAGNITASLDVEATTGFIINGSAGIDFSGAITNLTIEKGIVTAAS